jgi:23S rRNA (pseudouridine1915-N3)-methyltransferase
MILSFFPKDIAKAHTISADASQKAYSEALEPFISNGYSIALHPDANMCNSFEFSKLLSDKMSLNFFIGGAYGLEDGFLKKCDKVISLSNLTFSHKIAKAVLLEQIYRGFSILNNHPYHK